MTAPERRAKSITDAFAAITDQPTGGVRVEGRAATEEDVAAVRRVFDDVAAVHVSQVRNVMLELRFGAVECSWIESSRPALLSLRTMAAQMDLPDLCEALDAFCAGVDVAIAGAGAQIDDAGKAALLERYQRLIELIPQAFELDAERDRREPIIVESLLRQVDGVEKLTIDKLFAVGLGHLDALLSASADDLAAVAGIRRDVAVAIASRLRAYRQTGASVGAADAGQEQRQLRALVAGLADVHREFERASAGWSDEDLANKRELRKRRDQAFLGIKVSLARLGEGDLIARLDRMTFEERIHAVEGHVVAMARLRPATAPPAAATAERPGERSGERAAVDRSEQHAPAGT